MASLLIRFQCERGKQPRAANSVPFIIEDNICTSTLVGKLCSNSIRRKHGTAANTGRLGPGDSTGGHFAVIFGLKDFKLYLRSLSFSGNTFTTESTFTTRFFTEPK